MGLGHMGTKMVDHLVAAGYPMVLHDTNAFTLERTLAELEAKAGPGKGEAQPASSPAEVATTQGGWVGGPVGGRVGRWSRCVPGVCRGGGGRKGVKEGQKETRGRPVGCGVPLQVGGGDGGLGAGMLHEG